MKFPMYAESPSANAASLCEVYRRRAIEQPNDVAYTFLLEEEGQVAECTYAEIDREARAIAAELQQLGLQGQRALLVYDPGMEFTAAIVGCFYAGVIAVPAYPPDPMRSHRILPRLQSIVTDSQSTVLLSSTGLLEWAEQLFRRLAGIETVVATNEISLASADKWSPVETNRDTVALLQYTSGSTGTPKGVVIDHGNLIANLSSIHELLHRENNVICSWLPPYHDMGLIGNLLGWHSARHTILLSPLSFFTRPIRWLKIFEDYKATCSAAPDFAYDHCINKISPEDRKSLDLGNWEVAINGAEMIRPETLDRFLETFGPCGMRREAFYPSYGMAESTLMVSCNLRDEAMVTKTVDLTTLSEHRVEEVPPGSENSRTFVGCGRPVRTGRVIVADPESLQRLPDGEVGEIWLAGPSIARGYWNNPPATEERFRAFTADDQGPFLRTGDFGFLDGEQLYITGRLKDVIIVWGRNHYPQDIEQTVERVHPDLKPYGSAVFSVELEGRERVVLIQELRRPQKHDLPKLMESIRNEVAAEHQIPLDAIVFVKLGTVPKTSSGKIQRSIAREEFLAGALDEIVRWQGELKPLRLPKDEEFVAPRNATERVLAEIWSEALGVERVGIHDNFFDLGGHSLLATQLATRMAPQFEVEIPLRDMFERPTIAELAMYIDQVGTGKPTNGDATTNNGADLAAMLEQLEGMTESEVAEQLAKIDPVVPPEE